MKGTETVKKLTLSLFIYLKEETRTQSQNNTLMLFNKAIITYKES